MGLAKTALAIGIAVVFAVFIAYGLFTVYEPPKYYEDGSSECYSKYNCSDYMTDCYPKREVAVNESAPVPVPVEDDCWRKAESSPEYRSCMLLEEECEDEFEKTTARYRHGRNSFWILFVIAVLAIVVGIFMSNLEAIGSGLIGGGVLVLLWSLAYTARYWIQWSKYAKLVALGLVLVLLVYLGYKRIEHVTKKNSRKSKRRRKK